MELRRPPYLWNGLPSSISLEWPSKLHISGMAFQAFQRYGAWKAIPEIWSLEGHSRDMELGRPFQRYGAWKAIPEIWSLEGHSRDMELGRPFQQDRKHEPLFTQASFVSHMNLCKVNSLQVRLRDDVADSWNRRVELESR